MTLPQIVNRIRNLRHYLSDQEVVGKLLDSGVAQQTAWFALVSARILDQS